MLSNQSSSQNKDKGRELRGRYMRKSIVEMISVDDRVVHMIRFQQRCAFALWKTHVLCDCLFQCCRRCRVGELPFWWSWGLHCRVVGIIVGEDIPHGSICSTHRRTPVSTKNEQEDEAEAKRNDEVWRRWQWWCWSGSLEIRISVMSISQSVMWHWAIYNDEALFKE